MPESDISPQDSVRNQKSTRESPWLTRKQAGEYIRLHPKNIYKLVREGYLQEYRLGGTGHPRYRREDLDKLLGLEAPKTENPDN